MVNVYIRRKKNFVIFYSRRRRGFETQGPSSPPSCKDTTSLKEVVHNNEFFSNVNDFTDIGFVKGIPIPCISELSHENAELEFESNATVTTIKRENGSVLDTRESLPNDVLEKDRIPIDIGLINKESLLTVIQQLASSLRPPRRPRSARKPTSSTSRKWSRFENSASDDSKQKVSHFGESTSVCCNVIPKTPIKEDKISKFTSRSLVSDVHSLLSTGMLEGAPVKYMKDNVELSGIVTTLGIYCGCSLCNFKEVVSSLKFEEHAGSRSHNQNAHIFLETGISLYALSKELKNVSLESLGKMIAEKFGYPTIMEVYKAWKGNSNLCRNKGESSNQKNFPDFVEQLQANLNFPKGPRSTRTKKPPLGATSKVNQKVSRQLTFCDVDLQHSPAHKKRGVDIVSSNELSSKKSSEITSSEAYESTIREFVSQNVEDLDIGKKKAIILTKCTPDSPLSTVSCLLATGLLDGIMVNYKKDEIDLRGIIKDSGICCGCESCRFSKVLSSLDFGKHGGDVSRDPNDDIFVNDKITLYSLVRELGNVPLGLLSGELIQKMIGCQPNIVCFLAWKESFRDKKSYPQRTSGGDRKNQLALVFPHCKPSAAERLRLSGSEENLPLLSGEDVKVNLPRKAEKAMKHKEQDFHQQIFDLLNDGSKLSYRSHGKEVLTGYKFGKRILCSCCNLMLSASKFEAHAGHEKRRKPYHSIYTPYRMSLNQIVMLLLLDAPSINPINVLIPGCPTDAQSPFHASSLFRFHSRRLLAPCNLCCCMLCRNGEATLNFGNICDSTMLFCGQCGGMFHVGCLRNHGICEIVGRPCPSDIWLCGDKCKKVHTDLLDFLQEGSMIIPESLLNLLRRTSVGSTFSEQTKFDVHWQLLSGRFHGDKSKSLLQQATAVFQEAFGAVYKRHRDVLSTMVNGEKGVAEFFGGMFCGVLTVESIIVSAALLRVFDNRVAELLLAATPIERQGEGYFKILLWKIEEMLRLVKVENLVVAADEQSLPMWVEKFGFFKLSVSQIQEHEMNHRILRFENTTMLQKLVPSAAAFLI